MALHEAAHAVVDDELGIRVSSLQINEDGTGQADAVPEDVNLPLTERAHRKAVALWAGMVAEIEKYGDCTGSSTDEKNIRICASLLNLEGAEADDFIADARAQAEALVRKRREHIHRVAGELKIVRYLSADYFYRLIGKDVPAVLVTQTRRVVLPLQTRAAPITDAGGDTFRVCWGSGEKVKRASFDGYFWEDLPAANADLGWLNTGRCPVLNSHNSTRIQDVLGTVIENSAFVEGNKGFAKIRLGSNAPVNDIKSGTLSNLSIGYSIGSMERTGTGDDGLPIFTIRAYRILELSIVPVPADKSAQILRTYTAEVRG